MNTTGRNLPQPSRRRPRLPVLATPYRAPRAGSIAEPGRRFAPALSATPTRAPSPPPPAVPVDSAPPARVGSGAALPTDAADAPPPGFHRAVTAFKRRLIERTLTELGGNRTRAARALGLQRTYLLRLMREFEVRVPAGAGVSRRSPSTERAPP
jgi:hypothetical protein